MLSQLENRSTQPTLTASPAQPESSSSLAPSHRRSTVNSHRQPQDGHPDDNLKHQPRGTHQQHQAPVEPRLQSMIIYVNKNVSLKSFLHFLLSNCGSTLRTSINLLLIILFLLSPCILAVDANDNNIINNNNLNKDTNNNDNNNNDININNNEISKENLLTSSSLGNLDNFEDDFSASSMSHSRPVLLSSKLPVFPSSSSSSSLLSQSKSYSPITSSSASLGSPLQSSSPSSVSPDSYSILSSNPTQLSHYLQTKKSLPIKQSYDNSQEGDFQSLFHRIARRSSRPYDVPQIECPSSEDGIDRFACPSADRMGRYRCIEDHVLCNGFYDCPNGEDEDRKSCMFYKTTKAHLDVLADAMLRMVRGRF
ncbi:putative protein TPRXL [Tetranychus urticae]|uniref:putative protein TPRXL n=1 Tax=Tetranychus urticae TaxID=32264 RepID=UPI00077BF103|nr:putative protein TPRXL [Tetranychus urticae]